MPQQSAEFMFDRRQSLQLFAASLMTALLPACRSTMPVVRIGSNGWPGYAFIELAGLQKQLPPEQVRILRMPSSTAAMQALSGGALEGACLTLDEVIMMCADGMPLKVVGVLDVSNGADMVLAHASVRGLAGLAGKRIGVEQTAVGAVMLDALLRAGNLARQDVKVVPLMLDRHEQAFLKQDVDAVITFEPVASRLLAQGAQMLFSSVSIPGRIVDVLAVKPSVLESSRETIRLILQQHFALRQAFMQQDRQTLDGLAVLLESTPEQVKRQFWGMSLPDAQENLNWLAGNPARLEQAANELAIVMQSAGLLQGMVNLQGVVSPEAVSE